MATEPRNPWPKLQGKPMATETHAVAVAVAVAVDEEAQQPNRREQIF
jgi:hypothetical protein